MKTRTIISSILTIIISTVVVIPTLNSCESQSGRRQPFTQPATQQPSEGAAEQQKVYFSLESVGKLETFHNSFLIVARVHDFMTANDSTAPKGAVFNLVITYDQETDDVIRLQRRMTSELTQAKTVGRPAIYTIDASDIKQSVKLADRYESKIAFTDVRPYSNPVPANGPGGLFDPARPK